MIGEDAVNATTENMHKLLQILLEIAREINRSRNNNGTYEQKNSKEKSAPKIKFGEMKFSDYKKMLNSGEKMHTVSVPADKLDIINNYSKQLGAGYWTVETDGKTAAVAVPEKYLTQFNDALTMAVKDQLNNDRSSLIVKDGAKFVPEKDIDIVRSVLDYHDIPVYSFKNADGNYMNIVPAEYDGQYEKAMQEVKVLKDKMQDIDTYLFDQTLPFTYIDNSGDMVLELTALQAEYLSDHLSDEKISFMKDENDITAVRFSSELENKVSACLDELSRETRKAEDYAITVVDSSITVNREKLLVSENESEYFTKVPNTASQDYIRINKDEAQLLDGGRTISTKLDFEKSYQIYDKDGNLKSERTGRELAAMYNTKSRSANKDTDISHYHNDTLERVELYNAKENKLISIGIENAETVRRDLAEQGITGRAAEKILDDINKSLPHEYKDQFAYIPQKSEVKFETVKSDVIMQYKIAEKIRDSEMSAGMRDTLGKKCCVLDKNTNQYVMVSANENRLREALESLGYDKLQINAVVSEVCKSYDKSGATLDREDVQIHSLETNNAEIGSKYQYCANNDNNGITIIKSEIGSDTAAFKYLEIEKNSSRNDIEAAIKSGFEIKDNASVAALMGALDEKGLISPAPSAVTKDGFEVSRITPDYISISRGGEKMTAHKNNIDTDKLCEKFGIDEKQADRLKKSLDRSLKAADKKSEKGQTLAEIKSAAKKALEKINAEKKGKSERTVQTVTSERSK